MGNQLSLSVGSPGHAGSPVQRANSVSGNRLLLIIMVMSILSSSRNPQPHTRESEEPQLQKPQSRSVLRWPTRAFAAVAETNTVSQRVGSLLAALYPQGALIDRRTEQRYPYPHLVYLTPLADDGITPAGSNIVVSGKQLSENGLGFFHQQPLPYRRMIASLDQGRGHWLGLTIDLSWCRFTKFGWYESGGRLLQVVASPLSTAPQLNLVRAPE